MLTIYSMSFDKCLYVLFNVYLDIKYYYQLRALSYTCSYNDLCSSRGHYCFDFSIKD